MTQGNCYACLDGLENQMAHIGGCLSDNYYYEDDIFKDVDAANTLLELKKEKQISNEFENAIREGHFVATQIPFSLFSDTWNYGFNFTKKMIESLRDDWGVHVNEGDWIFTTYSVPFDIAEAGAKEFNWDYIYKVPEKYYTLLMKARGSSIRYGLPKGEEFVTPIKRQYYGHPALFNLKTNKPFKNLTPVQKKMKKKLYEFNQLRMYNIEKSGYGFQDYYLGLNLYGSYNI